MDGCSKETSCRRTNEQFTDARTFGKRRQEIRASTRGPLNVTRSKSPVGKISKNGQRASRQGLTTTVDANDESWREEDEGITLYDEVVRA